jgi:1,4-alpha-glucan branching enzyme
MVHVDETGKATFRFRHTTAGPVHVVGDFCHWASDHLPMRRVSDTEWLLMLRLPPGTYQFRYFADGEWFTDYAAFGVDRNAYGEYNSVVRIPKVRPAVRQPVRVSRIMGARWAASA